MKRCSATILPTAFFCFAAAAFGQTATPPPSSDETVVMDEFTVTTATRSAKAVDHIPGAVNLITSDDVQNELNVSEDATKVLEETIPGYSESRGSISVSGETLRGRTPLYLLDGIPMSTPLREGNAEGSTMIDNSLIERIEVVNGPSATEGLGAAGGIINFITKTAKADGNTINFDTAISSEFDNDDLGWRAGLNVTHKADGFDLVVGAAFVARPMDYDAHGRLIGMDANGTAEDTQDRDLFIKTGYDFGTNHSQRIQFMINRNDIAGNGNYHEVDGVRVVGNNNSPLGITDTAARGEPIGKAPSHIMQDLAAEYSNSGVLGGTLTAQFFQDREAIMFAGAIDPSKQDPTIAPIGTLADQSEVDAHKYGARTIFVRPDLVLTGLEGDVGVDYLHDMTQQDLALTNRVWVPPINYSSWSPFAQLEYDQGPITIRGGARYTEGTMDVSTYKTIYVENSETVQGGSVSYSQTVYNLGGVYRLPGGWSLSLSDSEGFQLPDVGLLLRSVNTPNQSVSHLADVQAIISTNHEASLTWRGKRGSFGVSVYDSYSALGSTLIFTAATDSVTLTRVPTDIKGLELTGEVLIVKGLTVTALFSDIHGKTAIAAGLPLNVDLGAANVAPKKLVEILNWKFLPEGTFHLTSTQLLTQNINLGVKSSTGSTLQENFEGYSLFDASVQYHTKWAGTWSIGVENLFNKYYLPYIDSEASSATTIIFYFAGRGRVVSLSISISF